MTDAPERIWAWEIDHATAPPNGYYALFECVESVEYIRADLVAACWPAAKRTSPPEPPE